MQKKDVNMAPNSISPSITSIVPYQKDTAYIAKVVKYRNPKVAPETTPFLIPVTFASFKFWPYLDIFTSWLEKPLCDLFVPYLLHAFFWQPNATTVLIADKVSSAMAPAFAYAFNSNLVNCVVALKSHNIGRTFILLCAKT